MSNCNCIEKLTAAMEAEAAYLDEPRATMPGVWATAQAASVRRLAARLAPATAEPQEPCMVVEYADDAYPFGIETSDRSMFWLWGGPRWQAYQDADFMRRRGNYKTRAVAEAALPAARAALLAASEPGVKPASLSECRTLTEATRYCMDNPEPTKPAPASTPAAKFDAKAWAEKMIPDGSGPNRCDQLGVLRVHDYPGARHDWIEFDNSPVKTSWARQFIAAALTAAHAAGRAEGCPKPRKWPEEKPPHGFLLFWFPTSKAWERGFFNSETGKMTMGGCDISHGVTWWLPQPAAPDAKEADHD